MATESLLPSDPDSQLPHVYDRELILQKHDNTHKVMLYLVVAWLITIAWVSVSFGDFANFIKNTPFEIIVTITILLGGAYGSLVIGFMYKCDEYENWIEKYCQNTTKK